MVRLNKKKVNPGAQTVDIDLYLISAYIRPLIYGCQSFISAKSLLNCPTVEILPQRVSGNDEQPRFKKYLTRPRSPRRPRLKDNKRI